MPGIWFIQGSKEESSHGNFYQVSSKEIQEFFKVLCVQKSMFLVTKETSNTTPPPPPKCPKDVSGYKIDLWVFPYKWGENAVGFWGYIMK